MQDIFISIVNMSFTASYVIAAIMLARLFLKKAPKIISYILWSIVGFRLVFPLSFESVFSLIPFNSVPIPADIAIQPVPRVDSGINIVDNAVSSVLPAATPAASVNPLQIWQAVCAYIWLAGIAIMLIYSVAAIILLKRQLRGAVLCEGNVYEVGNLKTPFVLGFIRPKIYILSGLSVEEKSYITLHEQTHIKRFDHLVKLFAFFLLCVHWFNPLVWAAFILMSTDMEMSCDERVLKEMGGNIKKAYSTSLLSMATGRRLINGSPLAFGERNIKGRINNVLNFKKPSGWVIVVSVAAAIIASVCLLTNPPKAPEIPAASFSGTDFSPAPAYAFDKCLYMNPLSSYYPAGTTGQLYLFNPDGVFTIVSEETGEVQEIISPVDLIGKEVNTQEWDSLFNFGDPVDISSFSVRRQYELAGKYLVYQMDEEVWLASVHSGNMWSLYRLKETTKPDFESNTAVTELKPASPEISLEQEVGVDMAQLDYASDNIVIFHDYFGLFVYDLNSKKIARSLDLKPIGCTATQGDNYCEVTVSADGNTVQLHPMSSKDMYVYTVSENTLQKMVYKQMDNRFSNFVDITDVINYEKAGTYSHSAVKFDTGEYGYLHTSDWKLGTLTYIRGGDMVYRLFGSVESSPADAVEPWELTSRAFAEAFFEKDDNVMKSYLLDPEKSFHKYSLDGGSSSVETMKLKYNPDNIKADSASVQYEFKFDGEDSYTYLQLDLKKVGDVWKIEFYGLEK